jgi:3-deoxy-manno-octulosonate cytidylyltransferase (CMP-KDO synthetase)
LILKTVGVIPARLGSTRLPNKVLLPIAGKPMIQHVWEQAKKIRGLDSVLIACDDQKILDEVAKFGGKAVLTRVNHPNGTSRIEEAVEKTDAEIVVNIQGDQPLLDCPAIESLADFLKKNPAVPMATLAIRSTDSAEYRNPNVVKLVQDASGQALYFSRSPVPFLRDSEMTPEFWKHIGVYGYRKDFLKKFVSWSSGRLEEIEKLDQLRVLERGYPIQVIETKQDFISVDTAEDLKQAERLLS